MRRRVFFLLPAVFLTAALVVAAQGRSARAVVSGTSPSPSGSPSPPAGTHVGAWDDYFIPAAVSIGRGDTVIWDFVGTSHHTATDISGMELYNSGSVAGGGASIWFTFDAAGIYPFNCTFHPGMSGRVSVPVRAAPATGSLKRTYTITWAAVPAQTGYTYDVQRRPPGGLWKSWQVGTTARNATFAPRSGKGVYRFRARMREVDTGAAARWSDAASISAG